MKKKILHLDQNVIKNLRRKKKQGKKIVLCHGAFDLVHPGHIEHLQEAKSLGDILIVTITSDKFIKKSVHSPYFDQNTRQNFLSKIKIIDHVFILDDFSAVQAIKQFRPNYYCKGLEYKETDVIGNLALEKKALNKVKGKLKFLGENVKSSSTLISKRFFNFKDKIIKSNLSKLTFDEVGKVIKKIRKLKVLVVGESILDQYTYVKAKGISPKSGVLSCVQNSEEVMPGGVLATFNFLSSITKSTSLTTIVNKDLCNDKKYKKLLSNFKGLIKSKEYTKIVKNRIMEKSENNSLSKMLTLNQYKEEVLSRKDENLILNKLRKNLSNKDIVIVQDFGHGFFTKKIVNLILKKSKKLSINVQANSLNYGFNIIGRKFNKTKIYSLDERELELFTQKKNIEYLLELKKLNKYLSAQKGFLTCGGKFSLVVDKNEHFKIPTLNRKAIDTVGAGDIFHAMASLLSCVTKNNFLILFLSQIAGAHAANIRGNSDYPKISEIVSTFNFYKKSQ